MENQVKAGSQEAEANPRFRMTRSETREVTLLEVVKSKLPRKAPKYRAREPYRKPTQVGGMNNPRRSRELWPRNSAK